MGNEECNNCKLEHTIWGDGHEDRGLAGQVEDNAKTIKYLQARYNFALGGLSGINCILGVLFGVLKLRG